MDYQMTRGEVLDDLARLCGATELPGNADFENGFAEEPDRVAANVTLALEAGVAGPSIEDRRGAAVYPLAAAVARVSAARDAIDRSGTGAVLVARAEGLSMGLEGFEETVERLRAFAAAGTDCLYALGLGTPEDVRAVVHAVAPKPVNAMLGSFELADLAALGVRRVSTAGALARAAWNGFDRLASRLAEDDSKLGA